MSNSSREWTPGLEPSRYERTSQYIPTSSKRWNCSAQVAWTNSGCKLRCICPLTTCKDLRHVRDLKAPLRGFQFARSMGGPVERPGCFPALLWVFGFDLTPVTTGYSDGKPRETHCFWKVRSCANPFGTCSLHVCTGPEGVGA